jgi:phosphoribosylformylglycinamidine synthase
MGIGIVEDVRHCTTTDLKQDGNLLYLVGPRTRRELGGSAYLQWLALEGESVPRVEPGVSARAAEAIVEAAEKGLTRSVHDLSEGGLGVAVCEMGFGGDLGARIDLAALGSDIRPDILLFSETNTRYLVEVAPDAAAAFEAHVKRHGTDFRKVGTVAVDRIVVTHAERTLLDVPVAEARAAWQAPIHEVMG